MKKILSILISILLVLISAPVFAISGSGTEANPYLVSTPQDVCNIHNDLDGYYKLTADIDMSGIEFEPIGNESEGAFAGTIDGNGHTISNLNINLPDNKYVGFVGYLEGCVKNLHISNSYMSGYKYVGEIVGYAYEDAEVRNCDASGIIYVNTRIGTKNTVYCGGIIGYNSGLLINCINFSSINVNGSCHIKVGGIVGYSNTLLSNCKNIGNILVSNDGTYSTCEIGGILGRCDHSISDCVNNGKIELAINNYSGTCSCGGIVGVGSISIASCINSGDIVGDGYSTYTESSISGICGTTFGINIIKSINTGYIEGNSGIIGGINGNVEIESCLNSGSVKYSGIAFKSNSYYSMKIIDCYNTGCVRENGGNSAGIVGGAYSVTENCYNSGVISYIPNDPYCRDIGDSSCNNCYQLNRTKSNRGNSILLSYEEFKDIDNFSYNKEKWFSNINLNSGFPQLRSMPRHIDLNECIEIFEVGDSDRLYAYINGNSENVTWSCDDNDIATVSSNGTVTAKAIGACTVTATNSEGMKANCLIYVYGRADSVQLNKYETSIAVGSNEKLIYTENPDTANETVVWKSDNENVATVEQNGAVTAKTKGIANITATTTNSEVSASCRVTVTGTPITSISLSPTSATMNVGENKTLTATVSPTQYSGTLTWSSSNNDIATVDNGVVTAKAPGTAVISIESDTNKTATCTVTVKAPVTELSFDKTELALERGYTQRLNLNIVPLNTTDTISWSSYPNYVSVSSDGIITANSVGTATITATAASGKKAYCVVNVTEPTISVSSVTLNKTELIMTQADRAQLTAEVLPSNATNKELVWTSTDEAVATVSNTGVVTATGAGTAIIKATANNGMYHECAVKVISASGSSVVLSSAKASPNGTAQVKASIVRNPGISGYKFTVDYDDTLLTPISVEANSKFGGSFTSNLNDNDRTELIVFWYSGSDVDINGDLFTVNFKVNEAAEYGDSSDITLSYGARDIGNASGGKLALYIQNGTVIVEEPLPGDIYEDNEINAFDLNLLSRYITRLDTLTERQLEAADVNNDNEVDIKDVVTVAQYLVNWTGVELMSFRGMRGIMGINVGTASINETFEAEIPVYVTNNSGVAGFRYVIEHSDDLEVLSITPTMDTIKDKFQTNLGQQGDNDLIVSWYNTDNMTENGELFIIKVRLTNPDADISQISIKPADNNMCNENKQNVIAEYEDGYVMNRKYIITNKTITDTTFDCELYFDNTVAEQTAKAILGFYNEQNKLVQFALKDITVKPGKVDLNFDIEDKPYSTYKLMLWEGLNSMRPLVDVR